MKSLIKILKGVLIGIAAIVPGFSGGTIACIVNCYDELIEAISGIKKHFKQSILTLLPYLLGILIGALSIFPISWGLNNYPLITVCLFAGLLIGSMPSFYNNIKGKATKNNLLSAFICGILFLGLIITNLCIGNGNYVNLNNVWWVYIVLVFVGAIGSAALVVPGISGSMMLMIIGFYNPIMDTIKGFIQSILMACGNDISLDFNPNFNGTLGTSFIVPSLFMLLCFALGIIIGFYLISKLMKYLLTNHKDATYYAIFSFILVSLVGVYAVPSYYDFKGLTTSQITIQIVLSIVFLIVGFVCSFFLTKLADKKINKIEEEIEVK